MRSILALFLITVLSIAACNSPEQKDSSDKTRPNIIFIMTDDHAYQAISTYGSVLLETPGIDRLAKEGMRFDKGYVTNSICSPSRAVALTGKFSHLNGVTDNIDIFDSTQMTFPKLLRENGYQTAVVGKWHLKSQPTGFDYWKILPDQGEYYHPEFRTPNGITKESGYVTDVITNLAINILDSIRENDSPFLLMYHHKAPHRHWWPSMEELANFKRGEIPEPATLFDDYRNRGTAAKEAEMRISDHMALSADTKIHPDTLKKLNLDEFMDWYEGAYLNKYNRLSFEEQQKWDEVYGPINADFAANPRVGKELTYWKYQRYMEDYLSTIRSVDDNIGRLLNYLDSNDLSENTLVIYTSDQGFYLGEHGWFDKRFMYEPSFRTPLIMRWPSVIDKNLVNNDLVQNIDFAPTMLQAAEVDVPTDMQGMSLMPLMKGEKGQWRDALYYHYYEYPSIHMVKRHYGLRTDKHKLIHFYHNIDEWELYDLENDPEELVNLYDSVGYEDLRSEMHKRLNEIREQYGDSDELTQKMLEEDLSGWYGQN